MGVYNKRIVKIENARLGLIFHVIYRDCALHSMANELHFDATTVK